MEGRISRCPIGLSGVLAAAIQVTDEPGSRSLPLGSHHQGGRRQLGPHVIAHGPADDLADGEIEDGSQVESALTGGQGGDIAARSFGSASQTVFGIAAENCCFRRLGAIGTS